MRATIVIDPMLHIFRELHCFVTLEIGEPRIARLGGFRLAEMQHGAVRRGDAGDGLADAFDLLDQRAHPPLARLLPDLPLRIQPGVRLRNGSLTVGRFMLPGPHPQRSSPTPP